MLEEILQVVSKQLDVSRETLSAKTRFDAIGCDSLEFVNILLCLEIDTGIRLGLERASGIETIGQLAEFYEAHCAA